MILLHVFASAWFFGHGAEARYHWRSVDFVQLEFSMFTAVVYIHVKPESVEQFIEATRDNVRNSLQEVGITRFDFLQQQDDPTRFVLYETYRTPEDQLKHRETAHYARWRDAVADMMAEPRSATKYDVLGPVE
jgi:quinol monooxygenase YgiN